MPPGAAGITNPIDQDKQKAINKAKISCEVFSLNILKQIKNPINFDKIKSISKNIVFTGYKDFNFIFE